MRYMTRQIWSCTTCRKCAVFFFFFFDLNTQYIHLQPREIEYVEIIRWRCLYNAFLLFSKLQEVINMSVRSRSGLVYI